MLKTWLIETVRQLAEYRNFQLCPKKDWHQILTNRIEGRKAILQPISSLPEEVIEASVSSGNLQSVWFIFKAGGLPLTMPCNTCQAQLFVST